MRAGWYPDRNGGQRFWTGSEWATEFWSGQEKKKSAAAIFREEYKRQRSAIRVFARGVTWDGRSWDAGNVGVDDTRLAFYRTSPFKNYMPVTVMEVSDVAGFEVSGTDGASQVVTGKERKTFHVTSTKVNETISTPQSVILTLFSKTGANHVFRGTLDGPSEVRANLNRLLEPRIRESLAESMPISPPSDSPASTPDTQDPIAVLTQLAKLRDAGVISHDEFEAKKREILDRI